MKIEEVRALIYKASILKPDNDFQARLVYKVDEALKALLEEVDRTNRGEK